MKKALQVSLIIIPIIGGTFARYLFWRSSANKQISPPLQVSSLPVAGPVVALKPPPNPESAKIIGPPVSEGPALPPLDKSDAFMLAGIAHLTGNRSSTPLFMEENLVTHIVSTIDNLLRQNIPANGLPVDVPNGSFKVKNQAGVLSIDPANSARYAPYMRLVDAVDAKAVVRLYLEVYPLLQNAYEQLGHPKRYFNDRLLAVLDDLIKAPEISPPIRLVQQHVLYQFSDDDLENRSAGQKMMIRLGLSNEHKLKEKLEAIRSELMKHLRYGGTATGQAPPSPSPTVPALQP
ncbi:DUF3014 domain-containing protein [Ferrovum sp.]|uniref:DUF3014 domain-containing protein n=1 Tax=Ferrovum sp. TaxID=2609467 RepID=UPI00261C3451|nr:DUF3014 domain-containing protein [Ferrovum sp.]